jgi:cytosine/adenosine deaminase-related metal-dependent hydrolase
MGTDGLCSSPSLNVWDEVSFAWHLHSTAGDRVDPLELLAAVTHAGATALGLSHKLGAIAPGMLGELAVLTPPGGQLPPNTDAQAALQVAFSENWKASGASV